MLKVFMAGLGKRLTSLEKGLKRGTRRVFHFYWSSREYDICRFKSRRAEIQLGL